MNPIHPSRPRWGLDRARRNDFDCVRNLCVSARHFTTTFGPSFGLFREGWSVVLFMPGRAARWM